MSHSPTIPARPLRSEGACVHARLPSDEFYWAMLESTPVGGDDGTGRDRRRRLEFQFEESLPVPIESVSAAFVRSGDMVIACAVDRGKVDTIISPRVRTLTPEHWPSWIDEAMDASLRRRIDPRRLNVLRGDCEPPSHGRGRRRFLFHLSVVAALVVGSVLIGVERRIGELRQARRATEAQIAATYAGVLGDGPSLQPPSVRLAAELRELRRLRPARPDAGSAIGEATRFDAAAALVALLGRVPPGPIQTESLDVSAQRITLLALVPTTGAAQELTTALGSEPVPAFPWRLRQPQISSERRAAGEPQLRLALTLERAELPREASEPPAASEAAP